MGTDKTAPHGKCATYSRVSTSMQDCNGQMERLSAFAKARGYEIFREYSDPGISGSRTSRPAFDAMMADARHRRFDSVIVERLDRLGRSLRHLVLTAEELQHLGVSLISVSEGLDLASPVGRFQFQLLACLAEFERALIRERVIAGLESARRRGKRLGRPMIEVDMERVRQLMAEGLSLNRVAVAIKIAKTTLLRRLRGDAVAEKPSESSTQTGSP